MNTYTVNMYTCINVQFIQTLQTEDWENLTNVVHEVNAVYRVQFMVLVARAGW